MSIRDSDFDLDLLFEKFLEDQGAVEEEIFGFDRMSGTNYHRNSSVPSTPSIILVDHTNLPSPETNLYEITPSGHFPINTQRVYQFSSLQQRRSVTPATENHFYTGIQLSENQFHHPVTPSTHGRLNFEGFQQTKENHSRTPSSSLSSSSSSSSSSDHYDKHQLFSLQQRLPAHILVSDQIGTSGQSFQNQSIPTAFVQEAMSWDVNYSSNSAFFNANNENIPDLPSGSDSPSFTFAGYSEDRSPYGNSNYPPIQISQPIFELKQTTPTQVPVRRPKRNLTVSTALPEATSFNSEFAHPKYLPSEKSPSKKKRICRWSIDELFEVIQTKSGWMLRWNNERLLERHPFLSEHLKGDTTQRTFRGGAQRDCEIYAKDIFIPIIELFEKSLDGELPNETRLEKLKDDFARCFNNQWDGITPFSIKYNPTGDLLLMDLIIKLTKTFIIQSPTLFSSDHNNCSGWDVSKANHQNDAAAIQCSSPGQRNDINFYFTTTFMALKQPLPPHVKQQENFRDIALKYKQLILTGLLSSGNEEMKQNLRLECDKSDCSLFQCEYNENKVPTKLLYFYKGNHSVILPFGSKVSDFIDYRQWHVFTPFNQRAILGGLLLMQLKTMHFFLEEAYLTTYGKTCILMTAKALISDDQYCGLSCILNMR